MNNVKIIKGRASVRILDEAVFRWLVPYPEDGRIFFTEAYRIESSLLGDLLNDNGLCNCTYSVMGRKFQDLSFADGKTLQKIKADNDSEYELREYPDGKKFLYVHERVPIFDSYDSEWGDRKYTSVYADTNGVNLIHTYCGDKIGSVEIYLGLKESIPVLNEYLKYLDGQS